MDSSSAPIRTGSTKLCHTGIGLAAGLNIVRCLSARHGAAMHGLLPCCQYVRAVIQCCIRLGADYLIDCNAG